MTIRDFFDRVNDDPELEGIDIIFGHTPEEDAVVVREHISGGHWFTRIATEAILTNSWTLLRHLITAEVPPNPLILITRIVGYYSATSNWNESKLGELKDRRKGNYGISSGAVDGWPDQVSR